MRTLLFLFIIVISLSSCDSCNNTGASDETDGNEENPINLCENNVKDQGEEGVDCGGSCLPCHQIDPSKEITITDLNVVNSVEAKTGELSFGKLLRKMASDDEHYKRIILGLFGSWSVNQTINGFVIPARPNFRNQIINQWKTNQGVDPATPDENWLPDPEHSPFRLLAITNRVDLASLAENKAGEGRLTFGQADEGGNDFTLILEYKLSGSDTTDVIQWAKRWHTLSKLNFDEQEYIDTLSSIVSLFTRNGEDLSQLRTNSVIGGPWEFREFVWNTAQGELVETTRKQNPDVSLNNSQSFANYLNDQTVRTELLSGTHNVPLEFNGQRILSGNAIFSGNNNNFTWSAPNVDQNILQVVNFISCVGCHGGFTPGGIGFTHIKPRADNVESEISDFLFVDTENRRKDNIATLLQLPTQIEVSEKVFSTQELEEIKALMKTMEGIPTVH